MHGLAVAGRRGLAGRRQAAVAVLRPLCPRGGAGRGTGGASSGQGHGHQYCMAASAMTGKIEGEKHRPAELVLKFIPEIPTRLPSFGRLTAYAESCGIFGPNPIGVGPGRAGSGTAVGTPSAHPAVRPAGD